MTTNTQGPVSQSLFPDYIRHAPLVEPKTGEITPPWDISLGLLFQTLQTNFTLEGYFLPLQTQTVLDDITASYAPYVGNTYSELLKNLPDITGQTVYNLTTNFTNQFVIQYDSSSAIVNLATWVPLAVLLTGTVAPTGVVAGVVNYQYLDTSTNTLYVCTATGSTTTATWTTI